MKIDAIAIIKQEIESKKSHVLHLKKELDNNWNSSESKYQIKKDLKQAAVELENAINEVAALYLDLRQEFDQNNSIPEFRILE